MCFVDIEKTHDWSHTGPVGNISEYGVLELLLWTTIRKGHQGCPLPFKPAFDFHEQDLEAPQNLRPWFSAAKRWVSRSGLGEGSYCPKPRISRISDSY